MQAVIPVQSPDQLRIDFLIDRLIDLLIDRLIDLLIDRLINFLIDQS